MTLPGRNLFPGWLSLEMTGGTSSTLSQGVTAAAGPRWPRFLPGARQEPAAEPALPHSFPVFPAACGFPGMGQGHRAPQPGTAGVKLLVCKCCQSQAGAARKTSCLLQPVLGHTGNGSLRTVALPSTAPSVGKWDKICLCIPRASPTPPPAFPLLIPMHKSNPGQVGAAVPALGEPCQPLQATQRVSGWAHAQPSLPVPPSPNALLLTRIIPGVGSHRGSCQSSTCLAPTRTWLGCDTGTVLVAVTLTGRAHATADPMPTHRARSGSRAGPCPSRPAPAVRHQARVPAPSPHGAPNSRHSLGAAQRSPGEAAAAAGRRRGERSGQYLLRRHLSLL